MKRHTEADENAEDARNESSAAILMSKLAGLCICASLYRCFSTRRNASAILSSLWFLLSMYILRRGLRRCGGQRNGEY